MADIKVKSVKITCKNCGSEANSDEFKLDYLKGIMVCPNCDRKNNMKIASKDIEKNKIEKKPRGWDETDSYLERAYREKNKPKDPNVNYEKIEGSKYHVMYTCDYCKYKFRYNILKQWPRTCPSCDSKVKVNYRFF